MWETWKKGFDAWENATAQYLELVLKSPLVLWPAGMMLTSVMKTKAAIDKSVAQTWGLAGLPTKRDQERALHQLHRLESKILDLEERLEDLQQSQPTSIKTKAK
jgi:hypothetical protein